MIKYIYILSLIVFCAISYQLGFNQKNIIVYSEIQARSNAERKLIDMQIRILQEELEAIRADRDKIFEFATGAGMKCC